MKAEINTRKTVLELVKPGGTGAEIGVHLGDFSQTILRVCQPKKLYLIDPWKCFEEEQYSRSWYGNSINQTTMDERHDSVINRFAKRISDGQVEVLRELSEAAATSIPNDSLDFIYIDGDHSYEGAKADIHNYFPKVKKGGLIIGDDYVLGKWWKDGVTRAFHELISQEAVIIEVKVGTQIAIRKL